MRIQCSENLRFPAAGSSALGESDPKLRPKGVGDGHQVDIPELSKKCLTGGGTQEDRHAVDWNRL